MIKETIKKHKPIITDILLIAFGTCILSVGIGIFMAPNKISSGGISTVGTVLLHLFGFRLSVTNLLCNAVLFAVGFRQLGKYAVVKTALGILLLSLFLELTAFFPGYTDDLLVSTVAGGILMGLGLGLVIRRGGSTGGSDFAALIVKHLYPHISVGSVIMAIDCTIISLAGIIFQSFTVTVYSAVGLYISTKITDWLAQMGDKAKAVQIFSASSQRIADSIMTHFERGITGIHCRGMYSGHEGMMLLCVVSPKELPSVVRMVRRIDKSAFIVVNDAREVLGEGFKLKSDYD